MYIKNHRRLGGLKVPKTRIGCVRKLIISYVTV